MFFVRPQRIGVVAGRLQPCPASPNCVCSTDPSEGHAIDPFTFAGPWEAAKERLKGLLRKSPRTRIVVDDGAYLRAECTSLICRYVDDLEFLADPAAGVIHVRSASRVGYSDLGVNRQRVERLRTLWERVS